MDWIFFSLYLKYRINAVMHYYAFTVSLYEAIYRDIIFIAWIK